MIKRILKFKALIVLSLVMVLFCSETHAWLRGRHNYYYRGGRWHRHGLLLGRAAAGLAVGAAVASLPPKHTTVIYSNVPYYYADGYYFRPSPNGGYVVVQPPEKIEK